MSKTILLTGATGMLGSNVLRYFLDKTDWSVTATNTDLTQELHDRGHFDVILHLASRSSVADSIADPAPFILNNLKVTLNVLEYARKYPPDMFINFSTTGIYSPQEDHQGNKWGSVLPTNPYIGSKLAQESIAYSYFHTYKLPIIIVSSGNVIGPNQSENNFVPKIIKAIQSDKEVPIYTNKGEIGSRVYNPVKNVADALMFIIQNIEPNMDNDRPDTFTLSGGEQLNNLEMAWKIADILGKQLNYSLMEANSLRPGYDAHYAYSDNLLERLGWKPVQTLDQGLKEVVEGYK